jgi:hypothetical protein
MTRWLLLGPRRRLERATLCGWGKGLIGVDRALVGHDRAEMEGAQHCGRCLTCYGLRCHPSVECL